MFKGRGRKGAIYIFPSGRHRNTNNCATNGYLHNPYVITIASANQHGYPASYSERCSAVFATAYSGDLGVNAIVSMRTEEISNRHKTSIFDFNVLLSRT